MERVRLAVGSVHEIPVEGEKGLDLKLGLHVVRMARNGELDVATLSSQDQDLAEVARQVRDISWSAGQWLKVVSAFAGDPNAASSRSIERMGWVRMNRDFYDTCLDPRDYRPDRQWCRGG